MRVSHFDYSFPRSLFSKNFKKKKKKKKSRLDRTPARSQATVASKELCHTLGNGVLSVHPLSGQGVGQVST